MPAPQVSQYHPRRSLQELSVQGEMGRRLRRRIQHEADADRVEKAPFGVVRGIAHTGRKHLDTAVGDDRRDHVRSILRFFEW